MALLDELAALHRAQPTSATVVISGEVGIGKTALALTWGQRNQQQFPHGAIWLDLADYRHGTHAALDATAVLEALLRALTIPAWRIDAAHTRALKVELLHNATAGQHLLIVVDNAEATDDLLGLLPSSTTCVVLITTAVGPPGLWGLREAKHHVLTPLDDTAATELAAGILGASRIEAADQAWEQILTHCAGNPLALRLAAVTIATRRPSSLTWAARRLTGETGTCRATLGTARSTDVVASATALALQGAGPLLVRRVRRLAEYPGHELTPPVAAAVLGCGTSTEGGEILQRLTDRGLLTMIHPNHYRIPRALARTIRHATPPLSAASQAAAVAAGLRQLARTAVAAIDVLGGSGDSSLRTPVRDGSTAADLFDSPLQALAWLEVHRRDLQRAVTITVQLRELRSIVWPLHYALSRLCALQGGAADWIRIYQKVLPLACESGMQRRQSEVRFGLAMARLVAPRPYRAGSADAGLPASAHLDLASRLASITGSRFLSLPEQWNGFLPYLSSRWADPRVAEKLHCTAAAIFVRDHNARMAHVHNIGLAESCAATGRSAQALALLNTASQAFALMDDRAAQVRVLITMAAVHLGLGKAHNAADALARARMLLSPESSRAEHAAVEGSTAIVADTMGQHSRVRSARAALAQLLPASGSTPAITAVLETLEREGNRTAASARQNTGPVPHAVAARHDRPPGVSQQHHTSTVLA
ncbi:ATP-binding protein [Crossiella sp. S99.2]|nr:ATP-binding protein [Crossiella sp. S99.1]MCK2245225.1 ATP-binding protein [Crossiella sp. S99.2]